MAEQFNTLEEVLAADPLGSMYETMRAAMEAVRVTHPDECELEDKVMNFILERIALDPTFDERTEAGKQTIAAALGVSMEDLLRMEDFQREYFGAMEAVSPAPEELIAQWKELKHLNYIRDVDAATWPAQLTRPMLVLYSADWCHPCRMIRPTFAQLVLFYDKAEVRYCHDEAFHDAHGVDGIPQFIAHFPNGSRVMSDVGNSAQEMWDTMNNLVALGQAYQGDGRLVCTQDSCRISPSFARTSE